MTRILYKGDIKLIDFKQGMDVTFTVNKPIMDTFMINLKPFVQNNRFHNWEPLMTKIDYSIDKKIINFDTPVDWLKVYKEQFCIKNFGESQIPYKLEYDRRLMNIKHDTGIIDASSTAKFIIDFGLIFHAIDKCCDLHQLVFGTESDKSTKIKIKIGGNFTSISFNGFLIQPAHELFKML